MDKGKGRVVDQGTTVGRLTELFELEGVDPATIDEEDLAAPDQSPTSAYGLKRAQLLRTLADAFAPALLALDLSRVQQKELVATLPAPPDLLQDRKSVV